MMIIGCDLHTRFQQIAMLDTETGEIVERRVEHGNGEAQQFYAALAAPARVGIEATGYSRWFERMLAEQGHELWIGDASAIRAARVRQQKTDARDALLLLDLLAEDRFPKIWVSSPAERDVWQLLRHRHKLVGFRTSLRNQLHALAMGEGVCRKKKLWSRRGRQELESLALGEWASRRRQELLEMLDRLDGSLEELNQAVAQQAESHPAAVRLMQQPGVGPVTGLALALAVGPIRALSQQPQAGQLSGPESARIEFGRQTAARSHQQTRQLLGPVVAGGSRAHGLAQRPGIAAGVPTLGAPPRSSGGEGGHRSKIGGATVLEAARTSSAADAASSHAG
jgi:transposase